MILSELASGLTGTKHPLYALRDELLAEGRDVVDLVRGNVNEHGMQFPPELLDEILLSAARRSRIYRPDPFGQLPARQAVAGYYRSLNFAADQILLTPGTSVSYWYCFKLLAEPGDQILCPVPSYPLLDYIARLCGVELSYYRLSEPCGWALDLDHLESCINGRTRAIVLISPHNPTGMVASPAEIESLVDLSLKHDLPIIADEVFAEFVFGTSGLPRPAQTKAPLVFTLNGFSKTFALPGLKIGWIVVSGNDTFVRRSLDALEMISDTFLPVSEIAQFAVPEIFERGKPFLDDYRKQVWRLRDQALAALAGANMVSPRAGFYLTAAVNGDEDELAMRLLAQESILVHPGHFYEMEGDHFVLTFIGDEDVLPACLSRVRRYI
jgi:alanine-synthesizing transaminase